MAIVGDQLVDAVQTRSVIGDTQRRAHAEAVDGSASAQQRGDPVLVQAPAGDDPHLGQPGGIETLPSVACQRREIARIQADPPNIDPRLPFEDNLFDATERPCAGRSTPDRYRTIRRFD
jgi:hypothetical protein